MKSCTRAVYPGADDDDVSRLGHRRSIGCNGLTGQGHLARPGMAGTSSRRRSVLDDARQVLGD